MNAKIAIPHSNGQIFQHFGKTEQFKIYTVIDDAVTSSEVVDTAGEGHEALGLWLVQHGVNAVICGDIGPGALGALQAAGIVALAGVTGAADEAMAALLAGTLEVVQTATCNHHAHGGCGGHGGCGSSCGGHGGGCHGCCH